MKWLAEQPNSDNGVPHVPLANMKRLIQAKWMKLLTNRDLKGLIQATRHHLTVEMDGIFSKMTNLLFDVAKWDWFAHSFAPFFLLEGKTEIQLLLQGRQ